VSNALLHERLASALEACRRGDVTLSELRDSFVLNARALEAMPYALVKGIDDIEYLLTVANLSEEDESEPNVAKALDAIEAWLAAAPKDV
jgi:hypothetical protein